jgi:type 1 glutamine amidotransferase
MVSTEVFLLKQQKKILVLGTDQEALYHPFGNFRDVFQKISPDLFAVMTDVRDLTTRKLEGLNLLVSYLEVRRPGFTRTLSSSIKEYVRRGGNHLVVHSGIIQNDASYQRFVGGTFTGHPPFSRFQVKVHSHPITEGMTDFRIRDELYLFRMHKKDVRILLSAEYEGKQMPLAWCFSHGKGKVVYLGLGHNSQSFSSVPYRKIIKRCIEWMMKGTP